MNNRIRALRKARGWTLAGLAKRIQPNPPTPQTVARLETGTRTLSMTWLEKIARALEVSPQDLLTLSKGPTSPVIASVGPTGLKALKQPPEVDLNVMAQDPVAIEFETQKGRYSAGDILIFDRMDGPAAVFMDEALVQTTDGTLYFGSVFPKGGGRPGYVASPAPHASLTALDDVAWTAKAVCLIRRLGSE